VNIHRVRELELTRGGSVSKYLREDQKKKKEELGGGKGAHCGFEDFLLMSSEGG